MKKILPFIIIGMIIVGVIFFYQKNSKDNKVDTSKWSNYTEEEKNVIENLSKENQDLLLNLPYSEKYAKVISEKEFKEENLSVYLKALNKLDIENTIYIVNNNFYDDNINYDENSLNFMHATYYIHENLERYLNYQKENNLSIDEIITRINSNLDYEYYTNMQPTDLSKKYLILVNKYKYLEKDYVPDNLVNIDSNYGINGYLEATTYEAFKKMTDAALEENVNLYAYSPYRSYTTQYNLYNRYGERDGYNQADTYSARAGSSEHQTGLAIDITRKGGSLNGFENTNEFKWLQKHATEYGFILRYPKGKEYITGYQYESWHYRYVGVEVAKKIQELGITFEEYYAYFVK